MKSIIFAILLLAITCAIVSMSSCSHSGKGDNDSLSATIDSVLPVDSDTSLVSIKGIVLDGSMNSVTVVTTLGDTLDFEYPERDPSKFDVFEINDSIQLVYSKRKSVEDPDSVVSLKNLSEKIKC